MKMFTCLTCFFFLPFGFFSAGFCAAFLARPQVCSAKKHLTLRICKFNNTPPWKKMKWKWKTDANTTWLSVPFFHSLSLSLSLDLEGPCSLSVWSLLACKLHWLPRCTFLSFFPTASLPSLRYFVLCLLIWFACILSGTLRSSFLRVFYLLYPMQIAFISALFLSLCLYLSLLLSIACLPFSFALSAPFLHF